MTASIKPVSITSKQGNCQEEIVFKSSEINTYEAWERRSIALANVYLSACLISMPIGMPHASRVSLMDKVCSLSIR